MSYEEQAQAAYGYAESPESGAEARLPVRREVNGLQELSQRMEKQVAQLRERLDPLLSPSEPKPKDPPLAPARSILGAHSNLLADIHEVFEGSRRRLQEIVDRLEI